MYESADQNLKLEDREREKKGMLLEVNIFRIKGRVL